MVMGVFDNLKKLANLPNELSQQAQEQFNEYAGSNGYWNDWENMYDDFIFGEENKEGEGNGGLGMEPEDVAGEYKKAIDKSLKEMDLAFTKPISNFWKENISPLRSIVAGDKDKRKMDDEFFIDNDDRLEVKDKLLGRQKFLGSTSPIFTNKFNTATAELAQLGQTVQDMQLDTSMTEEQKNQAIEDSVNSYIYKFGGKKAKELMTDTDFKEKLLKTAYEYSKEYNDYVAKKEQEQNQLMDKEQKELAEIGKKAQDELQGYTQQVFTDFYNRLAKDVGVNNIDINELDRVEKRASAFQQGAMPEFTSEYSFVVQTISELKKELQKVNETYGSFKDMPAKIKGKKYLLELAIEKGNEWLKKYPDAVKEIFLKYITSNDDIQEFANKNKYLFDKLQVGDTDDLLKAYAVVTDTDIGKKGFTEEQYKEAVKKIINNKGDYTRVAGMKGRGAGGATVMGYEKDASNFFGNIRDRIINKGSFLSMFDGMKNVSDMFHDLGKAFKGGMEGIINKFERNPLAPINAQNIEQVDDILKNSQYSFTRGAWRWFRDSVDDIVGIAGDIIAGGKVSKPIEEFAELKGLTSAMKTMKKTLGAGIGIEKKAKIIKNELLRLPNLARKLALLPLRATENYGFSYAINKYFPEAYKTGSKAFWADTIFMGIDVLFDTMRTLKQLNVNTKEGLEKTIKLFTKKYLGYTDKEFENLSEETKRLALQIGTKAFGEYNNTMTELTKHPILNKLVSNFLEAKKKEKKVDIKGKVLDEIDTIKDDNVKEKITKKANDIANDLKEKRKLINKKHEEGIKLSDVEKRIMDLSDEDIEVSSTLKAYLDEMKELGRKDWFIKRLFENVFAKDSSLFNIRNKILKTYIEGIEENDMDKIHKAYQMYGNVTVIADAGKRQHVVPRTDSTIEPSKVMGDEGTLSFSDGKIVKYYKIYEGSPKKNKGKKTYAEKIAQYLIVPDDGSWKVVNENGIYKVTHGGETFIADKGWFIKSSTGQEGFEKYKDNTLFFAYYKPISKNDVKFYEDFKGIERTYHKGRVVYGDKDIFKIHPKNKEAKIFTERIDMYFDIGAQARTFKNTKIDIEYANKIKMLETKENVKLQDGKPVGDSTNDYLLALPYKKDGKDVTLNVPVLANKENIDPKKIIEDNKEKIDQAIEDDKLFVVDDKGNTIVITKEKTEKPRVEVIKPKNISLFNEDDLLKNGNEHTQKQIQKEITDKVIEEKDQTVPPEGPIKAIQQAHGEHDMGKVKDNIVVKTYEFMGDSFFEKILNNSSKMFRDTLGREEQIIFDSFMKKNKDLFLKYSEEKILRKIKELKKQKSSKRIAEVINNYWTFFKEVITRFVDDLLVKLKLKELPQEVERYYKLFEDYLLNKIDIDDVRITTTKEALSKSVGLSLLKGEGLEGYINRTGAFDTLRIPGDNKFKIELLKTDPISKYANSFYNGKKVYNLTSTKKSEGKLYVRTLNDLLKLGDLSNFDTIFLKENIDINNPNVKKILDDYGYKLIFGKVLVKKIPYHLTVNKVIDDVMDGLIYEDIDIVTDGNLYKIYSTTGNGKGLGTKGIKDYEHYQEVVRTALNKVDVDEDYVADLLWKESLGQAEVQGLMEIFDSIVSGIGLNKYSGRRFLGQFELHKLINKVESFDEYWMFINDNVLYPVFNVRFETPEEMRDYLKSMEALGEMYGTEINEFYRKLKQAYNFYKGTEFNNNVFDYVVEISYGKEGKTIDNIGVEKGKGYFDRPTDFEKRAGIKKSFIFRVASGSPSLNPESIPSPEYSSDKPFRGMLNKQSKKLGIDLDEYVPILFDDTSSTFAFFKKVDLQNSVNKLFEGYESKYGNDLSKLNTDQLSLFLYLKGTGILDLGEEYFDKAYWGNAKEFFDYVISSEFTNDMKLNKEYIQTLAEGAEKKALTDKYTKAKKTQDILIKPKKYLKKMFNHYGKITKPNGEKFKVLVLEDLDDYQDGEVLLHTKNVGEDILSKHIELYETTDPNKQGELPSTIKLQYNGKGFGIKGNMAFFNTSRLFDIITQTNENMKRVERYLGGLFEKAKNRELPTDEEKEILKEINELSSVEDNNKWFKIASYMYHNNIVDVILPETSYKKYVKGSKGYSVNFDIDGFDYYLNKSKEYDPKEKVKISGQINQAFVGDFARVFNKVLQKFLSKDKKFNNYRKILEAFGNGKINTAINLIAEYVKNPIILNQLKRNDPIALSKYIHSLYQDHFVSRQIYGHQGFMSPLSKFEDDLITSIFENRLGGDNKYIIIPEKKGEGFDVKNNYMFVYRHPVVGPKSIQAVRVIYLEEIKEKSKFLYDSLKDRVKHNIVMNIDTAKSIQGDYDGDLTYILPKLSSYKVGKKYFGKMLKEYLDSLKVEEVEEIKNNIADVSSMLGLQKSVLGSKQLTEVASHKQKILGGYEVVLYNYFKDIKVYDKIEDTFKNAFSEAYQKTAQIIQDAVDGNLDVTSVDSVAKELKQTTKEIMQDIMKKIIEDMEKKGIKINYDDPIIQMGTEGSGITTMYSIVQRMYAPTSTKSLADFAELIKDVISSKKTSSSIFNDLEKIFNVHSVQDDIKYRFNDMPKPDSTVVNNLNVASSKVRDLIGSYSYMRYFKGSGISDYTTIKYLLGEFGYLKTVRKNFDILSKNKTYKGIELTIKDYFTDDIEKQDLFKQMIINLMNSNKGLADKVIFVVANMFNIPRGTIRFMEKNFPDVLEYIKNEDKTKYNIGLLSDVINESYQNNIFKNIGGDVWKLPNPLLKYRINIKFPGQSEVFKTLNAIDPNVYIHNEENIKEIINGMKAAKPYSKKAIDLNFFNYDDIIVYRTKDMPVHITGDVNKEIFNRYMKVIADNGLDITLDNEIKANKQLFNYYKVNLEKYYGYKYYKDGDVFVKQLDAVNEIINIDKKDVIDDVLTCIT